MTIGAARTAIKTALGTVAGLRVYDFMVDNPQPPCAIVQWPAGDIDTRQAMGNDWEFAIPVQILVTRVSDRSADDKLDALIAKTGTMTSAFAAINADGTVTGIESMAVETIGGFGVVTVGAGEQGVDYLACSLMVSCYA